MKKKNSDLQLDAQDWRKKYLAELERNNLLSKQIEKQSASSRMEKNKYEDRIQAFKKKEKKILDEMDELIKQKNRCKIE